MLIPELVSLIIVILLLAIYYDYCPESKKSYGHIYLSIYYITTFNARYIVTNKKIVKIEKIIIIICTFTMIFELPVY